jgi:hypothetical protein
LEFFFDSVKIAREGENDCFVWSVFSLPQADFHATGSEFSLAGIDIASLTEILVPIAG